VTAALTSKQYCFLLISGVRPSDCGQSLVDLLGVGMERVMKRLVSKSGSKIGDGFSSTARRVLAHGAFALAEFGLSEQCGAYLSALQFALQEEPPPFGTDLYADNFREAAKEGQWLLIAIISRAESAAGQSRAAWAHAGASTAQLEHQILKSFAVDLSRHVLVNLDLLDLVFPKALQTDFRKELRGLCPRFAADDAITNPAQNQPPVEALMQINFEVLRLISRAEMERRSIGVHCPRGNRSAVATMLEQLLEDQRRHYAYSAMLISARLKGRHEADLPGQLCAALRAFDRKVCEEPIEFSYHQRFGNYP
jgi:hypothetical protein